MLTFLLILLSILIIASESSADVLEREMRLAYNTDSGSFSKKRKVGKHGHSSNLVAKTSIDAFYQQRPVSKPVVRQ